jgi:hypothetical protein
MEAEALRSIVSEREASPHFIKLLELQGEIAEDVTSRGEDIYTRARADVMRRGVHVLPTWHRRKASGAAH